jgi:hypothetical protein
MSKENRKPRGKKLGHRPKGLPKTGGRKKGTRNKKNVRLRDLFAEQGFDFVAQVMNTFNEIERADLRLEYLVKLAPFFMQRLRQEEESQAGALESMAVPEEEEISTDELKAIAQTLVKP